MTALLISSLVLLCLPVACIIYLAPKESPWRHWLEGAEQPFVVWTDHKNLAYLQSAKRPNSHRARWSLFFSRFKFTLTYRPGSHNVKPDALSRQHIAEDTNPSPRSILPPTVIAVITWEIELAVKEAQKDQSDPGNGPPNCLLSQILSVHRS